MVTSSESGVRCGTCRWWERLDKTTEFHGGMCLRFPPTRGPMGEFELSPETERFTWCGEWAHDPRRFEVTESWSRAPGALLSPGDSCEKLPISVRAMNGLYRMALHPPRSRPDPGWRWGEKFAEPRFLSIDEVDTTGDDVLLSIKQFGLTSLREVRKTIDKMLGGKAECVSAIRDLETGEVLAVRWPWEGEG